MTIDPTAWKDLPIAIAILLFVLGMTKLGFDGVKYVVEFLKSRDIEYNANTKKLIDDQNEFWRLFSDKQSLIWQNFIKDIVERSSSSDDMVAMRLTELASIIKSLSDDFRDHDSRTVSHRN